jgi:hypothetical protein
MDAENKPLHAGNLQPRVRASPSGDRPPQQWHPIGRQQRHQKNSEPAVGTQASRRSGQLRQAFGRRAYPQVSSPPRHAPQGPYHGPGRRFTIRGEQQIPEYAPTPPLQRPHQLPLQEPVPDDRPIQRQGSLTRPSSVAGRGSRKRSSQGVRPSEARSSKRVRPSASPSHDDPALLPTQREPSPPGATPQPVGELQPAEPIEVAPSAPVPAPIPIPAAPAFPAPPAPAHPTPAPRLPDEDAGPSLRGRQDSTRTLCDHEKDNCVHALSGDRDRVMLVQKCREKV